MYKKANDKVGRVQWCVRERKGLRVSNCQTLHQGPNQLSVTTYSYGDWEWSGNQHASMTSSDFDATVARPQQLRPIVCVTAN